MRGGEAWLEECIAKAKQYIDNAYNRANESIPVYKLDSVWIEPGDPASRVLFRTDLSEHVRYLMTHYVQDGKTVINIEALSGNLIGSKKSF